DPKFDFYCLVDSLEGVRRLVEVAASAKIGRPLQVLLEGGILGARTGCRTAEDALAVARAVKAAPSLALRGVEGFEDVLTSGPAAEQGAKGSAFLGYLWAIARLC